MMKIINTKVKRKNWFSLFPVFSVVFISLAVFFGCKSDSNKDTTKIDTNETTKKEQPIMEQVEEIEPELQFKLVDKRIKDSAAEAVLDLAYVASGDFTEGNLKSLVKKLFKDSQKMTGFKWYKHPTKIIIYLYTSQGKIEKNKYDFGGPFIARGHGGRVDVIKPEGMMLIDYLYEKKREVEKYGGYMDEDGPRLDAFYGKEFGLGGIIVDLSNIGRS